MVIFLRAEKGLENSGLTSEEVSLTGSAGVYTCYIKYISNNTGVVYVHQSTEFECTLCKPICSHGPMHTV